MARIRGFQLIAAVAAVALLGGCAQAVADTTGAATSSSRPSASSTGVPVRTAPIACNALASSDEVVALVGGSGAPHAVEHLQPGFPPSSPPWSVFNANGSVCGWGGLGVLVADQGTPQVLLELVPGLASEWKLLAEAASPTAGSPYDGGTSLGGSCNLVATAGFCHTNVLVGDAWLYAEARSYGDSSFTEGAFHAFVQGVVSRYAALPAPTPGARASRDCADPRVRGAVTSAFGALQTPDTGPPLFDLTVAQRQSGQSTVCDYVDAGNPERGWALQVSALDGVDPALFARYRQAVDHPGATAVDVSALPGTATGLIEPTEDSTRIVVDVLSGGTWLEVSTYATDNTAAVVEAARQVIASGWAG